jgi:hypothetical protein
MRNVKCIISSYLYDLYELINSMCNIKLYRGYVNMVLLQEKKSSIVFTLLYFFSLPILYFWLSKFRSSLAELQLILSHNRWSSVKQLFCRRSDFYPILRNNYLK